MNARQERGLILAATKKLTQKGPIWIVPSQTGNGKKYTVCPDPESPFCSCPDHEETGEPCKHLYAVQFTVEREQGSNGAVTETRTLTLTEKRTYRQPEWGGYNLAQAEEKKRFLALLHDLAKNLPNPTQSGAGRRRSAMSDILFACVFKTFSTISARRFGTDLDEAFEKGYLTRKIGSTMTWSFLESELLTPILLDLIKTSSLPLRAIESKFAVDSSGFSTSRFVKWVDEKYGVTRSGRNWVKCHLACGVHTHVVTAVKILDRDAADAPQFGALVKATAENFKIDEVSADKGYLSAENAETVFDCGGTPFIAFKVNSTGAAGGLFEKMFHYYSMKREEYLNHYHARSNVESTFSMIKAKFGDSVRSRSDVAMTNEVLCKILCHNICCVIRSQCELGIEPIFWGEEKAETVQAEIVQPEPVKIVDAVIVPAQQNPVARECFACVGA